MLRKKKYMKPEIEMVVFKNKDDNMSVNHTYLVSSNYNYNNMSYNSEINF